MKNRTIHHEVLLFTNTFFSKRQFCETNRNESSDSSCNQLQNACWNGLVFEILPDIIKQTSLKNLNYTWEVIPAENFIEIKIGAVPFTVSHKASINPYLFYSEKNFN
ncbi:MAG: hypothetical protein ACHQF0_05770 [Chitinophagales bacterium]